MRDPSRSSSTPTPASPRAVVLPPPVRAGARVGVAALSGPVDPERLRCGLRALEALGFRPVPARNLDACHGLFAGDDDDRLDAFHELVADRDLEAVLFARGGWGVLRILDRIDWDLLAERPRAYVGYSDLTPFLLQIPGRLGFATFHGPMVAADLARGLDAAEAVSLRAALAGEAQDLPVRMVDDPSLPTASVDPLVGPLWAGCLSLLASTVGTPWAIDFAASLLVLEDVAEPPYRVDRMLTHLRLSDTLTSIRGLIAGHFTEGDAVASDSAIPGSGWSPIDVLCRGSKGRWPFACGLAVGHSAPNMTLPLGVTARLDSGVGRLRVGDPLLAPTP
ncbi:MAG: LD-carboxypeptidase [Acidobacteriota bacterium]